MDKISVIKDNLKISNRHLNDCQDVFKDVDSVLRMLNHGMSAERAVKYIRHSSTAQRVYRHDLPVYDDFYPDIFTQPELVKNFQRAIPAGQYQLSRTRREQLNEYQTAKNLDPSNYYFFASYGFFITNPSKNDFKIVTRSRLLTLYRSYQAKEARYLEKERQNQWNLLKELQKQN